MKTSIVETLEIKRDPKLMVQIRSSLQYFQNGGKGIPFEKIDWGRREPVHEKLKPKP